MLQHHANGAAAPGLRSPVESTTPAVEAGAVEGTEANESLHYAAQVAAVQISPDRKRWLSLQARATRAGFVSPLIEGDDGRPQLIVTRWSMTRAFDDLAEAEAWVSRVEGGR